jgi:hypothetical protein
LQNTEEHNLCYINIEFAKLQLIRNEKNIKCGFILSLHGISHSFTIKEAPNNQISIINNQLDSKLHPVNNNNFRDEELQKHEVANSIILSSYFKDWINCLNEWVIRDEDLKKYIVHKQIGMGAQAKVYKIQKKCE